MYQSIKPTRVASALLGLLLAGGCGVEPALPLDPNTGANGILSDDPPADPENLMLDYNAAMDETILSWDPSPEPDILGYNIYRNSNRYWSDRSQPSSCWKKLNQTPITTTSFVDDQAFGVGEFLFYYEVTAVDQNGNESPAPAGPRSATFIPTYTGGDTQARGFYALGQVTGTRVAIDLNAQYVSGVCHTPHNVSYDPSRLEYIGGSYSPWLGNGGANNVFFIATDPAPLDRVSVAYSVLGGCTPASAATPEEVMTLEFEVRCLDDQPLSFAGTPKFMDSTPSQIPATWTLGTLRGLP